MSGAVINAGDFLIEKRALALIQHFIPEARVTVLNRVTTDYSNRIDELNAFDAIIFAGGPLFQPGLYRKGIPFVSPESLKDVHAPVFFVGGGLHSNFYRCAFTPYDKLFFDKGVHGKDSIGCRDIFTLNFLRHEGYPAVLTGCPAWYDLDFVEQTSFRSEHPDVIKKICVSEPANELNIPLLIELLEHLRKRYPVAEITLVNHRELKREITSKKQYLIERLGIYFLNISGSVDGFSIYDDCDLHVGFRVHAHIYNLSRRNLTLLFNEDIRGTGVNTTLGLDNLNIEPPTYRKKKLFGLYYLIRYNETAFNSHGTAAWMFDDYIENTLKQNYQNYYNAFHRMRQYYQNMSSFFELVCDRMG